MILRPRKLDHHCAPVSRKGEYKKAVSDFTEGLRLNPKSAEAHYYLGRALHIVGKPDDAILAWSRAVSLDCGFLDAYVHRGLSYAQRKDEKKALADAKMALKLAPTNPGSPLIDAVVQYKRGEYDKAIQLATKAIRLRPQWYYPWNVRGLAFTEKNESEKARGDFTEAIRLEPRNWAPYYNRARVYLQTGKDKQAIDGFTEAIRLRVCSINGDFRKMKYGTKILSQ